MVAEAAPIVSTKPPNRRNAVRIPLYTKIKARNLYVSQMLGGPEVAKATGLTCPQIYSLADREGWTKLRKELAKKAISDSTARLHAETDAVIEEIAQDNAELSLGTLGKAKVTLDRTDREAARDLQAYSQAAKNFVGMYRQARELDTKGESTPGNTVIFIGKLDLVGPKPIRIAEPVIDVAPAVAPA